MTRLRSLLATLSLVLSCAASPALGIGIDDFSNAFPANPCLPNSDQAVIFTGVFCDGATCPPDPLSSCAIGSAIQQGLSSVLAGATREIFVSGQTQESNIHAVVNTGLHRLEIVTEENEEHFAKLLYYGEPAELDLDFPGFGIEAVRFTVGGDVSPTLPLDVEVLLVDLGGDLPRPAAFTVLSLTAPGTVVVSLAEMTTPIGFDFTHVDLISVSVGDCFAEGCTPTAGGPRSYWIGPMSLDTHPVPATTRSWGEVKASYR